MIQINPSQLKCLNTLVSILHIDKEAKQTLVQGFSGGRASSSKDLSIDEGAELIKHLKSMDRREVRAEVMRKKIISMAHEMGWQTAPKKADMKRIDDWCKKFGYAKKSLDNHTYNELPALVTQFEKGPYLHYISNL